MLVILLIMKYSKTLVILIACSLAVIGCRKKDTQKHKAPQENMAAKKMLQGIWVNEDEESVAFRAKGDTIFYPDTTSQPVYFQIFNDTLVLHGVNDVMYPIIKQSPHLFIFKNQNGDQIRLTLSDNVADKLVFDNRRPQSLNQNKLIKRDTIVSNAKERYHCYVQINPTTYKVIKSTYNDEGVEVDNVYYDNIIHISVYKGALKVFSCDFNKQNFCGLVPKDFLRQSVLCDMLLVRTDAEGIHYTSSLCVPDSPSSYIVEVVISYTGKMNMRIANY